MPTCCQYSPTIALRIPLCASAIFGARWQRSRVATIHLTTTFLAPSTVTPTIHAALWRGCIALKHWPSSVASSDTAFYPPPTALHQCLFCQRRDLRGSEFEVYVPVRPQPEFGSEVSLVWKRAVPEISAMSSCSIDDANALRPCGHYDNCTLPPEQVQKKEVTVEMWQLRKITDRV